MALCRRVPADSPAPPKDYDFALVEARRSLDLQLRDVDTIRGRATSLLSLGGLIGTFVGAMGATQQDSGAALGWPLWVALGAFASATVAAFLVLLPREFRAALDPDVLVGWVDEGLAERPVIDRDLAIRIGRQFKGNQARVQWMHRFLAFIMLALSVELAALTYELIRST